MTEQEREVIAAAERVADNWTAMYAQRAGQATVKDAQDLLDLVKTVKRLRRGRRGAR